MACVRFRGIGAPVCHDRAHRRGRPVTSELATAVARPRSVQRPCSAFLRMMLMNLVALIGRCAMSFPSYLMNKSLPTMRLSALVSLKVQTRSTRCDVSCAKVRAMGQDLFSSWEIGWPYRLLVQLLGVLRGTSFTILEIRDAYRKIDKKSGVSDGDLKSRK